MLAALNCNFSWVFCSPFLAELVRAANRLLLSICDRAMGGVMGCGRIRLFCCVMFPRLYTKRS
jgi:hypothetical protein